MIAVSGVLPSTSESCAIGEPRRVGWSQAVALAHPSRLERWSVLPHSRVVATRADVSISLWLLADKSVPENLLILSGRARRLLGATAGDAVTLVVPRRVMLNVAAALVDDLPGAAEVDVSAAVASQIGDARGMAMLVTQAAALPVRLRPRKMADDRVRMSMLTRALVGLATARETGEDHDPTLRLSSVVQLSALGEWIGGRPKAPASSRWRAWMDAGAARIRRASRLASFATELGLRVLLRAPVVALRTTEALVGDDTNCVVRIAAPVMPLVGIKPGDQVIVEWERRQALATVLESVPLDEDEQRALQLLRRVDVAAVEGHEAAVLRHLAIGIPAEMRSRLGMPRRTVVTVRRRLLPLFIGRLNELTIPVGGLLLAAATVPNVDKSYLIAAIGVVTVLAMLPLRHRTPPRGRWL